MVCIVSRPFAMLAIESRHPIQIAKVEGMRRLSFCFTCEQDYADEIYGITFSREEGRHKGSGDAVGAFAEAICRAAILALGE